MFTMTKTISTSDIGFDQKIRYSSLIEILQDVSNFQYENMEVADYFSENGLGVLVVYRQVDIYRLPEYNERVGVATGVSELKSIYAFRSTGVVDSCGELLVSSYVAGAFVDMNKGKPCRITAEATATIPIDEPIGAPPMSRKVEIPNSAPEIYEPLRVRKGYLDFNNHVNNAKYFDIAQDVLRDGEYFNRLRVEYKAQAPLGAWLQPAVYRTSDSVTVALRNFDDESIVYCIIEYSNFDASSVPKASDGVKESVSSGTPLSDTKKSKSKGK